MLAQTIFLCAVIALVAADLTAQVAGAARMRAVAAAHALVAPALEAALAAYQRELGATIAAQAGAAAGPATAPPAAIAALGGGSAFPARTYIERDAAGALAAQIVIVPAAAPVAACPGPGPVPVPPAGGGAGGAEGLQCSPYVQELRRSLAIVVDAGPAAADGTVVALAHRRFAVTLRTFAQPPYAMLAGIAGVALGDGHAPDLGGYGNAFATFAPAAPLDGDTTLHVVYACTPAAGDCALSVPPAVDAPVAVPWSAGNAGP